LSEVMFVQLNCVYFSHASDNTWPGYHAFASPVYLAAGICNPEFALHLDTVPLAWNG
jgi:hypothetical protein